MTTTKQTIERMRCTKHKVIREIPEGHRIENGTYVRRLDATDFMDRLLCGVDGCTYFMKALYIKARLSESACDDRCTSATGDKCDCSCIGANHGVGT